MRGAFTAADATAAGRRWRPMRSGLLPFVLIRSVTATFLARGDTATPVKASLTAVAVNVGFKIASDGRRLRRSASRSRPRSAPGSISGWSSGSPRARPPRVRPSPARRSGKARRCRCRARARALRWRKRPVAALFADWTSWRDESTLAVLAAIGAVVYGGIVLALFGQQWLAALRRAKAPRTAPPSAAAARLISRDARAPAARARAHAGCRCAASRPRPCARSSRRRACG